jgi:hypothetical protein
MNGIDGTIAALDGEQAIRVLALTLDHSAPLPDPAQLRAMESGLGQALTTSTDLADYIALSDQLGDPGELAKVTLLHLVATRPDLIPVITQATRLADGEGTRFEPVTLAVGGLVMLALQTEVKLTRNAQGKWAFTFHKHPMRDSTLGQVISKLIAFYRASGG